MKEKWNKLDLEEAQAKSERLDMLKSTCADQCSQRLKDWVKTRNEGWGKIKEDHEFQANEFRY